MKLKLILALSFFSSLCFARIGETRAQCDARYGVAEVDDDGEVRYEKAGLIVLCRFHEGKCASIMFAKVEQDALKRPVEMSDAELEALLQANANGSSWGPPEDMISGKMWESPYMIAHWAERYRYFRVMTKVELARQEKKKADEDKANLKGF